MKNLKIFALLLILALFAAGCGKSVELRGNSTANITNRGYVATDGTNFYYRLGSNILRETSEGAVTTICAEKAEFINYYEGSVYFVNLDDNNTIYSMLTDGTNLTKISDANAWYLSVVDDWIYYADRGSEGGIYKFRTDGTGLTLISEAIAQYVNVTGGWIYYADLYNSGIHRIDTNGQHYSRISADECANLSVVGKQIYYRSYTSIGLYHMNLDGSNVVKLSDQGASAITVYRDQLYFSVYNDKTYRMSPEGENPTDIYYERALTINTAGDWLFFHSIDCSRLVRYNILTGEITTSQDTSDISY